MPPYFRPEIAIAITPKMIITPPGGERETIMQSSPPAPTKLPLAVRWRLVLLVKGFDDRQACELSFLRWLVEHRHLGGRRDGRDAPARRAAVLR